MAQAQLQLSHVHLPCPIISVADSQSSPIKKTKQRMKPSAPSQFGFKSPRTITNMNKSIHLGKAMSLKNRLKLQQEQQREVASITPIKKARRYKPGTVALREIRK